MGLDNLSMRTRVWIVIILTVLLWGGAIFTRSLFKDPKAEQAKVAEVAKQPEAGEKKDNTPVGKNEVPAKKEETKPAVKEPDPVATVAEDLNKLLAARGEEKQHTLGDDSSKLKVVFSDRGAAIRSITLNDHEASDRQTGRRLEPNANGQRPRLVLVTDDEFQGR